MNARDVLWKYLEASFGDIDTLHDGMCERAAVDGSVEFDFGPDTDDFEVDIEGDDLLALQPLVEANGRQPIVLVDRNGTTTVDIRDHDLDTRREQGWRAVNVRYGLRIVAVVLGLRIDGDCHVARLGYDGSGEYNSGR